MRKRRQKRERSRNTGNGGEGSYIILLVYHSICIPGVYELQVCIFDVCRCNVCSQLFDLGAIRFAVKVQGKLYIFRLQTKVINMGCL
jgi:hypothetical protein